MDPQKSRLYFIDNLRWLMIIFVVLMHVNVTYSMLGGWYYIEKAKLDLFQNIYFGIYGSFTQAYFMGFLFFIAGYFVPASYDRKGFGQFVKERLIRLGIPTLLFMLLIHPVTIAILNHYLNWNMNMTDWYGKYIGTLDFLGSTGPLWFALALLIFAIVYALIRKFLNPVSFSNTTIKIANKHIAGIGILISVLTFLMRIPFPIGTNIMNMQLCFFSQYIVLFILGIYFFRKNLLLTLDYRQGMNWFRYTLIFGILFWLGMIVLGDSAHKGLEPFVGHLTLGNAAYSLWESFFCVGVCVGLIVWFREKFNAQGKTAKFLSDNAFGVYVFHTPILVLISMLMKDVTLYPFLKYAIVAVITIPACFLTSALLRKIPGVAYIIK
ncbi:MAG TPA: acyltransferase family protein [Bacteroidales bacterium]|nr:acyltransferase family protein [Bacteroidales bacterium]